jgi:hypothetical protein
VSTATRAKVTGVLKMESSKSWQLQRKSIIVRPNDSLHATSIGFSVCIVARTVPMPVSVGLRFL